MIISSFINEIGNKNFATNYKTKEKIKYNNGVKITMTGPTSEMTNDK